MFKSIERQREYKREYYRKHRDKILEPQRAYRPRTPEKCRQWRVNAARKALERMDAQEGRKRAHHDSESMD